MMLGHNKPLTRGKQWLGDLALQAHIRHSATRLKCGIVSSERGIANMPSFSTTAPENNPEERLSSAGSSTAGLCRIYGSPIQPRLVRSEGSVPPCGSLTANRRCGG